jgi:hypothetical protein
MRDEQRKGVLVPRAHLDEVDVNAVDLGLELRQRVQPRLAPSPIVLGRPVARECLQSRQLYALRPICDELLAGEADRGDAPTQVLQCLVGDVDMEGPDCCGARRRLGWDRQMELLGSVRDATNPDRFVSAQRP